jgi:hypothetical protein
MSARTVWIVATAVVALAVATVTASGESENGPDSPIQTTALNVMHGSRATLMRFAGVGQLEVSCRERPRVAFKVKLRSAAVGVDIAGGDARVQTLDPGQRLRTSLASAGFQRWHVASSHGDGVRVVTASVTVTPVLGGRGACMFTAQSTRSGRIP